MRKILLVMVSVLILGLPLSSGVVSAEEGAKKPAKEYSQKAKRAARKFAKQLMEYKFLSSGERKRYLRKNPDFAKTLRGKKKALKRLQQSLVVKEKPGKEEGEEDAEEEGEEAAEEEEAEEEESDEEADADEEEEEEEDEDDEDEEEEDDEDLEDA